MLRPVIAFVAALALAAPAEAAPPPWPYAADIPRPAPVSVPLADPEKTDITRLLLASGPRDMDISPDGRRIAFISRVTGQPQVWVVDAAGGAPVQLTFGLGVDGVTWTPDGKAIVYGADKGGDERYGFYSVSVDGLREREVLAQSSAFTYFGDYSADGRQVLYATTRRNGRDSDIYAADLATGGSRLLLTGRLGLYPVAAQPKGSLVVLSERRAEDARDLSLLDLATGRETVLHKPQERADHDHITWAPDGRGFYMVTDAGREFAGIDYHHLATGKLRPVETPPHDVVGLALSPDGRILAWVTDEHGFHRLHARDLRSGRELPVTGLPAGQLTIRFARDAAVLAILVEGPATPGEIWTWSPGSAPRRAVAPSYAGVEPARLVTPTPVAFKARDGVALSGLLYTPPGVRGRAPVFLRLHGGPTSHAVANWKPDMQFLLANGIAVLDFNYRGSNGAGKAGARLNDKRLRVNEIGDLADAVAWIKTQPGLDGARVAVGGGSYGGYLTNAALGTYPDMFVGGVSEVGVADWVLNLESASPSLKASDRTEYGDIDDPEDRKFFASISPINNAAKIRTPILIQVGANDPRNGVLEQDRFVTAIRAAGGPVTYLRYEGEGHRMTDLANIIHFNRAKADFLLKRFGR